MIALKQLAIWIQSKFQSKQEKENDIIEELKDQLAAWEELYDHVVQDFEKGIFPGRYVDRKTQAVALRLKERERVAVKQDAVLNELYQVLGELDAPAHVLDQVQAAVNDEKLPHKTLLPFVKVDDNQYSPPVAIVTGSSVQWLDGAGRIKDRAELYVKQENIRNE